MGYTTYWKRLSATQLNIAIQAFSLIAIFFEGYDQYDPSHFPLGAETKWTLGVSWVGSTPRHAMCGKSVLAYQMAR
jgi:hypothetical protein